MPLFNLHNVTNLIFSNVKDFAPNIWKNRFRFDSWYFAENCEYDFDKTNFMVYDPVFCHFTTTKEKQELRTINPWPAVGPRHAK